MSVVRKSTHEIYKVISPFWGKREGQKRCSYGLEHPGLHICISFNPQSVEVDAITPFYRGEQLGFTKTNLPTVIPFVTGGLSPHFFDFKWCGIS